MYRRKLWKTRALCVRRRLKERRDRLRMRARTSCVIRKLNESSDQRAWNIEPPPLANFYEDRDEDGDEEEQKDEDVVITVTHQLRRIALLRRSVDWLCARGSYNPRESDFALTAGTVKR